MAILPEVVWCDGHIALAAAQWPGGESGLISGRLREIGATSETRGKVDLFACADAQLQVAGNRCHSTLVDVVRSWQLRDRQEC